MKSGEIHESPQITLALLTLTVSVAVFGQNAIAVAAYPIAVEFGMVVSMGHWLTTVYVLVMGFVFPLVGYLSARHPAKHLFSAGLLLFSAGSLLGCLAPNIVMVFAARGVQAMGAGMLPPLAQMAVFSLFPHRKRGAAMGVLGLGFAVPPIVSSPLAGAIVDAWGWRFAFVFLGCFALAAWVLIMLRFSSSINSSQESLDLPSLFAMVGGTLCLVMGSSQLFESNMGAISLPQWGFTFVGAFMLGAFIMRQLRIKAPLVSIGLLHRKRFTVLVLLNVVSSSFLLLGIVSLPLIVQDVQGESSLVAGWAMVPAALIIAALNPFTGRLLDKHGPRMVVAGGFLILAVGQFLVGFINSSAPVAFTGFAFFLRGVGLSMLIQPLTTAAISCLDSNCRMQGIVLVNVLEKMGSAVAAEVTLALTSYINNSDLGSQLLPLILSMAGIIALLCAGIVFWLVENEKD